MKKIYNPFLNIRLNSELGYLLVDNFNKKTFKLDRPLIKGLFNNKKIDKELLKNNILIKSNSVELKLYESCKFWRDYNCFDAMMYHVEAYRFPFLDYETDESYRIDQRRMASYAKVDKLPSFFKTYENKEKIFFKEAKNFPDVSVESIMKLEVHKTLKKFNKDDFEKFTYTCFGNTLKDENEKRFIKKTIPSGGAKHPIEAYFVFPKNSFLPAGVYHYNVKENGLVKISSSDKWENFYDATYFTFPKKAINQFGVVYTAMVERSMYRYRDIRSTRAIVADLGHAIQNTRLVGFAMGLLSITEYKLKGRKLKEILKIYKNNEVVLAAQTFFEKYE